MHKAMEEIVSTVNECCEKTLKMMEKKRAPEEKKEEDTKKREEREIEVLVRDSFTNGQQEDEFNRVRKIDKECFEKSMEDHVNGMFAI